MSQAFVASGATTEVEAVIYEISVPGPRCLFSLYIFGTSVEVFK